MSNKQIQVQKISRYTPTPSGFLHLGNIVNFLLTWAIAKNENAKIFLRIDDIDKSRFREEYLIDIFETLSWLDLPYDLGPTSSAQFHKNYSQHLRIDLYKSFLNNTLNTYYCNCSRSEIIKRNGKNLYKGYCKDKNVNGNVQRISIKDQSLFQEVGDIIVWTKDGLPSYQLVSIIDDYHYKINIVCRGEDLINSTKIQKYLINELKINLNQTHFFHKLILDSNGNKMSKSSGSTSIHYLRKNGHTKMDIFRLISQLMNIESFESKEEFYNLFNKKNLLL